MNKKERYKYLQEIPEKIKSNTINGLKIEWKTRAINFIHTIIFTYEDEKYYLEMITTKYNNNTESLIDENYGKKEYSYKRWYNILLSNFYYITDQYIFTEL